MRANRLLHLVGFLGKAQGIPPASGFVTTKMPDFPAPSQATSKPNFSRYIPLSARVRGNRTARLRALRDEVAQEVEVAMDIGPSTMPLPLMPEA